MENLLPFLISLFTKSVSWSHKSYHKFTLKQKERIKCDSELYRKLYTPQLNFRCVNHLRRDDVFCRIEFSAQICDQLESFAHINEFDSISYKSIFYNKKLEKEKMHILENAKVLVKVLCLKSIPSQLSPDSSVFFNLTDEEFDQIENARKQVVQAYKKSIEIAYKGRYISYIEMQSLS